MKLGWIGAVPNGNRFIPPPSSDWFVTSPQGAFSALYPDEPSALIEIRNPDFELCAEMDALLYLSGTFSDPLMLEVIDDIPCKVLFYHEGGEHDFLRWPPHAVLNNYKLAKKSDLILVWDTRALGLHQLYTDTPVLWWPLPYPIEYMDRALDIASTFASEILVSYSPVRWCKSPRNAVLGCLLAQYFMDNLDFYSARVFSGIRDEDDSFAEERVFLDELDCNDVAVIPRVSPKEYLSLINMASMVINLDYRRASGRITLECALTRTPVIATDQQPFAFQIYNGIRLHDIFDVTSMIDTGKMISEGRWHSEWLDLAQERAQHYSYTNKARVLQEAVKRL